MKALYGSYDHDDQHVLITSMRDRGVKRNGLIASVSRSIRVQWEIRGTSQTELTTKILAAEAAYHVHGQNFILKQDDDADSAHKLIIGGVTTTANITEFGFLEGTGVEYATKRTCYATIEGAIDFTTGSPGAGAAGDVLRYRDTLTANGNGGARWVMKELPEGNPVKHTLNLVTVRRMTQAGSAQSKQGFIYPALAGPREDLMNPDVAETKTGPYYVRDVLVYETSWNYQFAGGDYRNLNPTVET